MREWLNISWGTDWDGILDFALSKTTPEARIKYFTEDLNEESLEDVVECYGLLDKADLESDAYEGWCYCEDNPEDYERWYFNVYTGEIVQVCIKVKLEFTTTPL